MPFSKETALDLLLGARRDGRLAHAHLITGAPGSGKAWLAHRLAADVLGCEPRAVVAHPDAHFVYPESKSRRIVIDQIRNLEHAIQRKPLLGSSKVAIIGDADRLQPAAANAFLKTLEEPPPGTLMLLTSTLPEAILETVLSRCVETSLHGGDTGPGEDGSRVLDAMKTLLAGPSAPTVADAFSLARAVQEILAEVRERVADEHSAALKEEAKRYKNIVGTEAWLEEREEQVKALAEATAIRERERLIGCVLYGFGGALRVLHGGASPHPACDALAAKYSEAELLAKVDAWEEMRRRLALNLNEALTLESGFLAIARA
ncbi:MAG: hypothetical protein Fur0032_02240 [Terrimicrobiaceae bacterium]